MRRFVTADGFGPLPAAEPVVARIRELLRPATAPDQPPPWLRNDQVGAYRRTLAAVRRYGGALVALPVGSGKSFVALAVAERLGEDGALVVGPAALRDQWERLGPKVGVPVRFHSHDQVSRGAVPRGGGLIVIDESHHFRHPHTKRYRHLAPALVGRPALLLSATPVVNRAADLAAQLALVIRDDALAPAGVPSLARALGDDGTAAGLEPVVIRGAPPADAPTRRAREVAADPDPQRERIVAVIDRLALARSAEIAALIRVSLLRAVASSPAALLGAVDRYRRLLDHAVRARAAGHGVNRAAIRAVIGDQPDQLVMWELLDPARVAADLALRDARPVDRLRTLAAAWRERGDAKAARLKELVGDRAPAVVFTSSVATVHYLRQRIGGTGVAWITGSGAGIGPWRVPRGAVLAGFGVERSPASNPPWLLVASDVAAEGLNLQRARRIVHYDLPWTPIRLDQRDGRAIRIGAEAGEVEVVRFMIPDSVESRLGLARGLVRKAAVVERAGRTRAWGDESAAGETNGRAPPMNGWVVALADRAGAVAGFDNGWVLSRLGNGEWTEHPDRADELLDAVPEPAEADPAALGEALEALDEAIRDRSRRLNARLLASPRPGGRVPWRSARAPSASCDTLRRLVRAGPTAGEAMLLAALDRPDAGPSDPLEKAAASAPILPAFETPRLVALVIFRPRAGATTLPG